MEFKNHDLFALSALNLQTEDGDEVTIYRNSHNLVTYNIDKSNKKIKSFDLSLLIKHWTPETDIRKLTPDYDLVIDQILGNQRLVVIRHQKIIMSANL